MSTQDKLRKLDRDLKRHMAGLDPCGCGGLHHSPLDWDFLNINWMLDPELYVSPPSSLTGTGATLCCALLASACTLVTQGRIVGWGLSHVAGGGLWHIFRNQAPVGTCALIDCYRGNFYNNYARLDVYVGGGWSVVDTRNFYDGINLDANTWYKLRLTWWESMGIMWVRYEWWHNEAWEQLCDDIQDANNRWGEATSPTINRVGLYFRDRYHFDDTEIWRRVT